VNDHMLEYNNITGHKLSEPLMFGAMSMICTLTIPAYIVLKMNCTSTY
jgi:hypothetical protein